MLGVVIANPIIKIDPTSAAPSIDHRSIPVLLGKTPWGDSFKYLIMMTETI